MKRLYGKLVLEKRYNSLVEMNILKNKRKLMESGMGLGLLGSLFVFASPCCTLPFVFAFLAGLGISAAAIKLSGSIFLGLGLLLLFIGISLYLKRKSKNKCCE